jgi:MFS family permease
LESKTYSQSAQTKTRTLSYIHYVTLCGFLGWVFIYTDRMTFAPLFIPISQSLGLQLTEAGFILTMYMVGYVGMQIPFSLLSDRIGLKVILVPTYYISGLSTLLIGALGAFNLINYLSLLLLALLLGFSAAAFMPQMTALGNYNFPQSNRAFYNSLVMIGSPVGLIVALVSAGPLYAATGQWSLPLIVLGALTMVVATLFLIGLRDIQPNRTVKQSINYSQAIKNRNLLLLYLLGFCLYYGNWVLISWGPSFFQLNRGLPISYSGPITALYALLSIPAGLAFSRLSDRWARRKLFFNLCLPLGGALLFLAAYVSTVPQIAIALALYGVVGAMALNPIIVAWANDFVASSKGAIPRATVMGILNFSMMMSALLAPVVTPAVGALTGSLQWGFFIGVGMTAIGFTISLLIKDMIAG